MRINTTAVKGPALGSSNIPTEIISKNIAVNNWTPWYARAVFEIGLSVTARAYNWTGFYIGGNVGYGWSHRDFAIPARQEALN